jgi:hypothetical protein
MPMKTKDMLSNNHSSLHFYYHVYNKISLEEEKYPSTLVRCNMSNIFFILHVFCLIYIITLSFGR